MNRAELLRDVVRGASSMEAVGILCDALSAIGENDTALLREAIIAICVSWAFAEFSRGAR